MKQSIRLFLFLILPFCIAVTGCLDKSENPEFTSESVGPEPSEQLVNSDVEQSNIKSFIVFGPITLEREKGKPEIQTFSFSVQDTVNSSYVINVYNGDQQDCDNREHKGRHRHGGHSGRVSSAKILLNGELVVGPEDFNQQTEQITVPVDLISDNELSVELRSKPGSKLTIEIVGETEGPWIELAYIDTFEYIWSDYDAEGDFNATFYKPVIPGELSEFHALGHYGYPGHSITPNGYMLVARALRPDVLARPTGFVPIWNSAGLGADYLATFWKPLAPEGYECLGLVVTAGGNYLTPPPIETEIMCVSNEITIPNALWELEANKYTAQLLWNTDGTPANAFTATKIIPNKGYALNDGANANAIHVGTFTGSAATTIEQDMSLASWIDKRFVLQHNVSAENITTLINRHAPFVFMHPDEIYYPDDPSFLLDADPSRLCWGLAVNESEPHDFFMTNGYCMETTSASLMTDYQTNVATNPLFLDPTTRSSFRYWIDIPKMWAPGNINRARALVNILSVDAVFTDIQFWMYYPFNGPARVVVCPLGILCSIHELEENGRHYGDWEHVTLRLLNRNQHLVAVYMSRHDKGQWISRNHFYSSLQLVDNHPVVFAGKYSHAFYPSVNDEFTYHITDAGIAVVKNIDTTGYGLGFPTEIYHQVIQSDIPGLTITETPWLPFEGRWGPYEYVLDILWIPTAVFTSPIPYPYESLELGPTGLILKSDFNYGDAFDWFWYPTIE